MSLAQAFPTRLTSTCTACTVSVQLAVLDSGFSNWYVRFLHRLAMAFTAGIRSSPFAPNQAMSHSPGVSLGCRSRFRFRNWCRVQGVQGHFIVRKSKEGRRGIEDLGQQLVGTMSYRTHLTFPLTGKPYFVWLVTRSNSMICLLMTWQTNHLVKTRSKQIMRAARTLTRGSWHRY